VSQAYGQRPAGRLPERACQGARQNSGTGLLDRWPPGVRKSGSRGLFPYVPQQSGYAKRLRAASSLLTSMIRILAQTTSLWSDDLWLVDTARVGCGCSRETAKRSDLAGWAQYGYCAAHSRYF
jgi:hypothetical protein